MGRRMDDAGPLAALPALGNLWHRQRAAGRAASRMLVFAVALRALARRQRAVEIREAPRPSSCRAKARAGDNELAAEKQETARRGRRRLRLLRARRRWCRV